MPRANRRRPDRPLGGLVPAGMQRLEAGPDGDWIVRPVAGSGSAKTYRCPGCAQTIEPGTPHLVAWPAAGTFSPAAGAEERRHWHSGCWRARSRRR
ncbi:hypothetical protein [Kineococcus glutinatus]|uniref:hypothetical protein n=1 Tax=Kineococcus glutinatus TaxID=1070872 RepID=UPI003CD0B58D